MQRSVTHQSVLTVRSAALHAPYDSALHVHEDWKGHLMPKVDWSYHRPG